MQGCDLPQGRHPVAMETPWHYQFLVGHGTVGAVDIKQPEHRLKENSCVKACKAVFCMFGVQYNHVRAESRKLDWFWRSFENATASTASLLVSSKGIDNTSHYNLLHRSKQHQTYLVVHERSLFTNRSGSCPSCLLEKSTELVLPNAFYARPFPWEQTWPIDRRVPSSRELGSEVTEKNTNTNTFKTLK